MKNQRAALEWRDGTVPVSVQFDDPYFSLENGLAETRHVFLDGNHLPARFEDGFHVAELGFGTGLNYLVTLQAWRASGVAGHFRFTSFEAYPMAMDAMAQALSAFPQLEDLAGAMIESLVKNPEGFSNDDVTLQVILGDARETLPAWCGRADAWYLDGFSPAKNPELWSPELMAQVAAHTKPNGTAATYTSAGFVRRGLADAGFAVERTSGFGRKRHMTKAQL